MSVEPVSPTRRAWTAITDRWDILALIAVGGAVGSLARWGLTLALPHPTGGFPWATFDANVSGCLLIGVLMVFVLDVLPPNRHLRPFLGVGVLGGYTTFSSYMLDTRTLLAAGHPAVAACYLFGSLAAGLAAVWLGVVLARLAIPARRSARSERTRRSERTQRSEPTGRPDQPDRRPTGAPETRSPE